VKLIEECIRSGKQALYLLPEIALTTQLIGRLQEYFGEKVAVYHSKYNVQERVEVWNNVVGQKPKAQIVIGARSSMFLPFSNLGLIIVDEEHEGSFKQFDPAPRYHARDAAIVLANLHGSNILLGSATPSIETFNNARTGKYGYANINRRYGNVLMPDIEIVDIKEQSRKRRMKGHFSERLLEEMTYHQYKKQLRCHYCSHHIALQETCQACGSSTLERGKHGYERIITAFEQQELDILVGTQMLTKGLDFRNVNLVGIMNADSLLNFPDYRAHERSFQLLTQVAGRAGRTKKRGKVIIQSYNPYHKILTQVSTNDYDEMFQEQLYEREQYKYPPANRIIKITFKHKEYNKLNEAAEWFSKALRNAFGANVLGPEFPPVARIRNQYLKHVLVKIDSKQSLAQTKSNIKRIESSFNAIGYYRSVRVIYNVDHI